MNYASVASRVYTSASLVGWNEMHNGLIKGKVGAQVTITSTSRSIPFDLDLREKMQIITEDANAYEHASDAMKAFETGNMSAVITELYQIIDSKNIIGLKIKYEPLRDALSHGTPIKKRTIERLNNYFGRGYFVLDSKGAFEHTSTDNRQKLYEHAVYLLEQTLPYIGTH